MSVTMSLTSKNVPEILEPVRSGQSLGNRSHFTGYLPSYWVKLRLLAIPSTSTVTAGLPVRLLSLVPVSVTPLHTASHSSMHQAIFPAQKHRFLGTDIGKSAEIGCIRRILLHIS